MAITAASLQLDLPPSDKIDRSANVDQVRHFTSFITIDKKPLTQRLRLQVITCWTVSNSPTHARQLLMKGGPAQSLKGPGVRSLHSQGAFDR